MYERTEDKDLFKKSRAFRIENNVARVRALAASPSEDALVCALDNSQLFLFALSNAEIMKPEEMNFEFLVSSFHAGAATGLDTCLRKPLIATCGVDKSVRVWNYFDKSLELLKFFHEEAYAVALHPSGLHVLVGFADKMRLMNVLMDDIRPFKEFPIKACREAHPPLVR